MNCTVPAERLDPADLESADLDLEIAAVCGVLNQSYARLVILVGQGLESESWAGGGVRSPRQWLTLRAGLSPTRAREVVAVARRAQVLPTVMAAFAAGQLSLDQVVVVTRYAPAAVEASVADLASTPPSPSCAGPCPDTPSTPTPTPSPVSSPATRVSRGAAGMTTKVTRQATRTSTAARVRVPATRRRTARARAARVTLTSRMSTRRPKSPRTAPARTGRPGRRGVGR